MINLIAICDAVIEFTVTSQVDMDLLAKSCDNHTLSIDTEQLQSRYDNLELEKVQLQTNYISLGKVRDQLQKERDELQTRLSNIGQ